MSDQSDHLEYEEILELPDVVQDKLNESINLRKNLCSETFSTEQSIIKINDYLANNTHPVTIISHVKLHITDKYQEMTNQKVEECTTRLLSHLKTIRERELNDIKQKQQTINAKIPQELRHTLHRLKDSQLYNGDIDQDVNTYFRIYHYENGKGELIYGKAILFKNLKKMERLTRSAEIEAQRKADTTMEDPMEKLREEISQKRSQIQELQSSRRNQIRLQTVTVTITVTMTKEKTKNNGFPPLIQQTDRDKNRNVFRPKQN